MTPNARFLLVQNKTLGVDPLVDKLLNEPESPEGILYGKARLLNQSNLKKQYVEASLLSSSNLEQISDLLEIPLEVIEMYHSIFYEVKDLDKLSKMELLDVSSNDERLLKLWAFSQGLDFIAWRLGKPVYISPVDGLTDLFTTSVYKSKEALFNGNAAEASKESTKWVKLAMDLARLLKVWVMDSAAAKRDLEMALEEIIPDFGGLDALEDEMRRMDAVAAGESGVRVDTGLDAVATSSDIDMSMSIDDILP